LQKNGKNLVGVHEAAILGHGSDAVRVAIGNQPSMAAFFHYSFLQHCNMGLDRFGVNTGEQRVQFLTNRDVFNTMLAEDLRQHSASGAVHRIDGELKVGFGDQLEIGEAADRFNVFLLEINFLNGSVVTVRRCACV
jgi:protein tyrosine/serine phosphatase